MITIVRDEHTPMPESVGPIILVAKTGHQNFGKQSAQPFHSASLNQANTFK